MKEHLDRDIPLSASSNVLNRHIAPQECNAPSPEDQAWSASANIPINLPDDAPINGIIAPVRRFGSQLTWIKSVPIQEAFSALHPTVRRDIVRLCDFADNAFEFEQQFRLFCESNPFFLAQVSILLEKRKVKARITANEAVDEGWCVEDSLENVFNPNTRSDVSLHILKSSGDQNLYKIGTIKKLPLRNILPYNLK